MTVELIVSLAAVCLILIIILGGGIFLVYQNLKTQVDALPKFHDIPKFPDVNINTKDLENEIRNVPTRVMNSIQGSISDKKGKLGELIGYIELKGQYDRIIPIGSIVDFIAIRWPQDGKPGCVDLVDIKTGKYAKLSKEQKLLKQLIQSKDIGFTELKISQNRHEV